MGASHSGARKRKGAAGRGSVLKMGAEGGKTVVETIAADSKHGDVVKRGQAAKIPTNLEHSKVSRGGEGGHGAQEDPDRGAKVAGKRATGETTALATGASEAEARKQDKNLGQNQIHTEEHTIESESGAKAPSPNDQHQRTNPGSAQNKADVPPPPSSSSSSSPSSSPSSSEEGEEGEDMGKKDDGFPSIEQLSARVKDKRNAVSAESTDVSSPQPFTPPSHPKTETESARIKTLLSKSFLFSHLESKTLDGIVLAVKEEKCPAGHVLMRQGDPGDVLYIIESGELNVFKRTDPRTKPAPSADAGDDVPHTHTDTATGSTEQTKPSTDMPSTRATDDHGELVNVMKAGSVVGELALLYSAPRAATVICKDECKLWLLDRSTFQHMVLAATIKRREEIFGVLKKVPLLSLYSDAEFAQLADSLVTRTFDPGKWIVQQGDAGEEFFILAEGSCEAVKNEKLVMKYKSGDFFGELALLHSQPRAAGVKVTGDSAATVFSLERSAFDRLLGPVRQAFDSQAAKYGPDFDPHKMPDT